MRTVSLVCFVCLATLACACADEPPPRVAPPPTVAAVVRADEKHLSDLKQVTFGGDNGWSRWSAAGDELVVQSTPAGAPCARVVRVTVGADRPKPRVVAVGRTPAFLPDGDVVYAAAVDASRCADRDALDLVRAKPDGSSPRRLTESPGFDGEPGVCAKDGSIVFTSTRDGDPDLYRMDADGGHVQRLTASPGYDGGAVFDAGCAHVAWAAERHPGVSEIWVANADGTDAHQVTILGARSTSPAWFPMQRRLLFTSTYAAATGRDVDVWAVDADGTNLERVTTAPAFDGFPAFSPDGQRLAFSSMRATVAWGKDTNVFVARWTDAWRNLEIRPADHVMGDAAWLADPAREGRGLGSDGLEKAGEYIERSFESFGLTPVGDDGFRQEFEVATRVSGQAGLEVDGASIDAASVKPLGFSASATAEGPLVFVGSDADYARMDAKGKVVVVRAASRDSLRYSGWLAHEHGAAALLAVEEGALPDPAVESDVGIPAAAVSASAVEPLLARIVRGQHPPAKVTVALTTDTTPTFNVVAAWPASVAQEQKLRGAIVLGAHYDHIGERSPGADDNASGTAVLLQVARSLAEQKPALRRDVILVAFSGEEMGAAGATAFLEHLPRGLAPKDLQAMINLDMVGRLRDDALQVFGEETATQWPDLVAAACQVAEVSCVRATARGFGATDHAPFYEAGVPVLHLFTGVHGDYLKPTDTVDKLNATGMAQVATVAEQLVRDLSDLGEKLDYQRLAAPLESSLPAFRVTLGTIPDVAARPAGRKGMLLAGVRPGGPADRAGLRKGDLLVRLGGHVVGGVEDVMFVLTGAKPGSTLKAVVVRDGKEMPFDVTLEARR